LLQGEKDSGKSTQRNKCRKILSDFKIFKLKKREKEKENKYERKHQKYKKVKVEAVVYKRNKNCN